MEPVVAEWRAAVGGQLETQGHGILDLGWRRGPTSIQLFTDTVDLRTSAERERGRVTVGLRAQAFAAGMWITPWTHGAPDLTRAQRGAYIGPDLRLERWLPEGGYVAVEGFSRYLSFDPLGDATLEVPHTWWTHGDLVVGGWWNDGRTSIALTGGLDVTSRVSPHASLVSRHRLEGPFVPLVEARAAVATRQDDVTATRLGGLTPYHVPFAGAAWAEFWVEDYAAVRAGLAWTLGPFSLTEVVDLGAWTYPEDTTLPDAPDHQTAVGLGALGGVVANGWFVDLGLGYAPGLPRQDGVHPVSVYLLVGTDWLRVERARIPPSRVNPR